MAYMHESMRFMSFRRHLVVDRLESKHLLTFFIIVRVWIKTSGGGLQAHAHRDFDPLPPSLRVGPALK